MKPSRKEPPEDFRPDAAAGSAPPEVRRPAGAAAGAGLFGTIEFRLLAEQTLVGIAIRDEESNLYVNRRFAEIFGYTREEIIQLAPDALIAERDRARVQELLRERPDSAARRAPYTYQGMRKDGTAVDIESYGSRFELGGKPAAISIVLDITERKRAEEALRQSRNLLQTVLDAIPSAVFWKDRASVYLGGNRVFLEAAGLKSAEDLVGKNDRDLPWGKEQAESFRDYDRKVIESGASESGIVEPMRHADGTDAWVETNKVPLRDPAGNVIGILGTYEDITERKRSEEQVRRQLDELRRWHQATLGREDRIRELKAEVNALCDRLGEARRYAVPGAAPEGPRPPG